MFPSREHPANAPGKLIVISLDYKEKERTCKLRSMSLDITCLGVALNG